jgi:hypothetical protein
MRLAGSLRCVNVSAMHWHGNWLYQRPALHCLARDQEPVCALHSLLPAEGALAAGWGAVSPGPQMEALGGESPALFTVFSHYCRWVHRVRSLSGGAACSSL